MNHSTTLHIACISNIVKEQGIYYQIMEKKKKTKQRELNMS